jgi:hypothetical protein
MVSEESARADEVRACARCGGLLVNERCVGWSSLLDEAAFDALRCLQCGDLFDAVILRHRTLRATAVS